MKRHRRDHDRDRSWSRDRTDREVKREPSSPSAREPRREKKRSPERKPKRYLPSPRYHGRDKRSPDRRRSRSPRERRRSPVRDFKQERSSPGPGHSRGRDQEFGKEEKMRWGKPEHWEDHKKDEEEDGPPKELPSFEPSGKLAVDTNTYKGVVIKYNEPPEAKIPRIRWRLYPFKASGTGLKVGLLYRLMLQGEETLPVIYVHRQSAYLVGRDRKISDFPVDHPSCSKQHAVLQYRSLPFERPDGTRGRRTRPYIIDLGSANGTYLNEERIEPQRYYELMEKDKLKFGFSSREYVVLNEHSIDKNAGDSSDSEDAESDVDRAGAEEKLERDEDDYF